MTTRPAPRSTILRRWAERIKYPKRTLEGIDVVQPGRVWMLPSSTPELTPDDWRVIRTALQATIVGYTRAANFTAAEATQRTLDKVPRP